MRKRRSEMNPYPLFLVAVVGLLVFAVFLMVERIQNASMLAEKQLSARAERVAYRLEEKLIQARERIEIVALNPLIQGNPRAVKGLLTAMMECSPLYEGLLVLNHDGSLIAEVPTDSDLGFLAYCNGVTALVDNYRPIHVNVDGTSHYLLAVAVEARDKDRRADRLLIALINLSAIADATILGTDEDEVRLSIEDGRELVLLEPAGSSGQRAPEDFTFKLLSIFMGELPAYLEGIAQVPTPGWAITIRKPYGLFLSETLQKTLSSFHFYVLLFFPIIIVLVIIILAVNHSRRYFKEQAVRDGLTGLYNHRFLQTELRASVAKGRTDQTSFLMIDIDDFKRFNDSYGHQAGDQLLQELAGILLANTRQTDVVARYGGEEFAIVLSDTDPEEAVKIAQRIREAVKRECRITVSIGISSFPDHAATVEELIKGADKALYKAKDISKDRVEGVWNLAK
ncbi:MAG: diguanylate cyclase [Limnochordia bacterium]